MSNSSQQSQPKLCLNSYSPEYDYNYSPLVQFFPSSTETKTISLTTNEHDDNNISSQQSQETNDTINPFEYMQCYVLLTRCELDRTSYYLDQDTTFDLNRQIEELREEREEHVPSQDQPSPCMEVHEQQIQEEVDELEANKENISPMSDYSYYEFPQLPLPWP